MNMMTTTVTSTCKMLDHVSIFWGAATAPVSVCHQPKVGQAGKKKSIPNRRRPHMDLLTSIKHPPTRSQMKTSGRIEFKENRIPADAASTDKIHDDWTATPARL